MTVLIPAAQAATAEAEAALYLDAVTALLDRPLLAEIGWQPQRQRFRFPTEHPVLVPRRCRTVDCDARPSTPEGLCLTCHKVMTRSGADLEEFVALPRQWARPSETMCLVCRVEGHERPARVYGLCETCRSAMRNRGQSVDEYINGDDRFPPAAPRPTFGSCRVDSCQRWASNANPGLCFGHDLRWRKSGSPDINVYTSTAEPINGDVPGGTWLGNLVPLVVTQILFGVQRCVVQGRQVRPGDLNVLCATMRERHRRPGTSATGDRGGTAVHRLHPRRALRRPGRPRRRGATRPLAPQTMAAQRHDNNTRFPRHSPAVAARRRQAMGATRPGQRLQHRNHGGQGPLRHPLAHHLHRVNPAATPSSLDQAARERYLAELKLDESAGRISAYSRRRMVLLFRQFIQDVNRMGLCDPGGPLAGMARSFNVAPDEIPPQPGSGDPEDEVGRGLPEVIIAQLLQPANLGLLGPMWQRLVRLTIDTGRRPDELCQLRFHCLDEDLAVDADGHQQRHPVLVHDQLKTGRRGVRLPIAWSTAEVIKAQQDAALTDFPNTATDKLALFPRRNWNPHGERATSPESLVRVIIKWRARLQLYDAVFRDGHLERLLDSQGQPVPFPSDAVFTYAFRHTYAQRHIDAHVGLETLASLMGHTNLNTTGAYYRIRNQQKREALAKVTQYQLSVRGGVSSAPGTASHALRIELGSISTPMGCCVEPSNVKALGRACPFRHRCFGCAHFRTDVSHLPELRAYLHQLLVAREELADANPDITEWARRGALPSDEEIETVRRLIDSCEALLDQLPADERQELLRHIETLREGRQHLVDAVPVSFIIKAVQPVPTVFPILENLQGIA